MTKAEAGADLKRWQRRNALHPDEFLNASIDVQFRQLAALMAAGAACGWRDPQEERVWEVRKRWKRLREHFGV